jgi:hypothetical protein
VYIIVVLDIGDTVQASAPDNFVFHKGHKVLLNERVTVLGGKNYQFLKYSMVTAGRRHGAVMLWGEVLGNENMRLVWCTVSTRRSSTRIVKHPQQKLL